MWKYKEGSWKVKCLNTIIVYNLQMSLILIPSFENKNTAVRLLPWKAIQIDIEDECAVISKLSSKRMGYSKLMSVKVMYVNVIRALLSYCKALIGVAQKHS